jgi:hypothetical protein
VFEHVVEHRHLDRRERLRVELENIALVHGQALLLGSRNLPAVELDANGMLEPEPLGLLADPLTGSGAEIEQVGRRGERGIDRAQVPIQSW